MQPEAILNASACNVAVGNVGLINDAAVWGVLGVVSSIAVWGVGWIDGCCWGVLKGMSDAVVYEDVRGILADGCWDVGSIGGWGEVCCIGWGKVCCIDDCCWSAGWGVGLSERAVEGAEAVADGFEIFKRAGGENFWDWCCCIDWNSFSLNVFANAVVAEILCCIQTPRFIRKTRSVFNLISFMRSK